MFVLTLCAHHAAAREEGAEVPPAVPSHGGEIREFWLEDDGWRARALIEAMSDAAAEGLDPAAYPAGRLLARLEAGEDGPAVESAFTAAYLAYAQDLRYGRLSLRPGEDPNYGPPYRGDPQVLLEVVRALEPEQPLADAVRLAFPEYRQVRAALSRYRAIEAEGGWPDFARGPTLHLDAPDAAPARLAELHARLAAEDEALAALAPGETPDRAALAEALRRFQARHGLKADGVVGARTQQALAVPVRERIAQLRLTLERLRWAGAAPGDGIEVNIPAYTLRLRRGGGVVLESKVIVGQPDWPTPVFEAQVSAIELRPYWNIPSSIVGAEILPKLRRDPGYLDREGIEVLDPRSGATVEPAQVDWHSDRAAGLRYRQRPGPRNALGRLKLHMPNRYAVFLHDTPARDLFGQDARALSHGCVRMAEPVELVAWLLARDDAADRQAAESVVASGESRRLKLPKPVPVRMVYRTAWAEADGTVHFRSDVYGRDRALGEALRKAILQRPAPVADNPTGPSASILREDPR